MPEIKQYENTETNLRPTDMGEIAAQGAAAKTNRIFTELAGSAEEVGRQAGRDISGGIEAVGKDVVDYMDHQAETSIAKQSADVYAGGTRDWNQTLSGVANPNYDPKDPQSQKWLQPPADPTDPTVAKTFMDKMETTFDKMRENATTPKSQEFVERQINDLRNSFVKHTAADMGTMAADANQVKMQQTVGSYNQAVVDDPRRLDDILAMSKDKLTTMASGNPNLKGVDAIKLATEAVQKSSATYVKSAMLSAMHTAAKNGIDPKPIAEAMLGKYNQYLTGNEPEQITQLADNLKGGMLRDQEAQRKWQRDQETDKANDTLYKAILDPNAKVTDLISNPENAKMFAGRGDLLKSAIEAMKIVRTEQTQVDPEVSSNMMHDLGRRMTSDPTDPNHIASNDPKPLYDALNNHLISTGDFKFAMELQKNLGDGEDKRTLNGILAGAKDQLGVPTAFSDFQRDFMTTYFKAKHDGTLKPGDLDFSNPNSMVSTILKSHMPSLPEQMLHASRMGYLQGTISGDEAEHRIGEAQKSLLSPGNGAGVQWKNPNIQRAALTMKNTMEGEGRYDALGTPTFNKQLGAWDRAYGAYGVMGANVAPWTQKYYGQALSPQQFLHNQQAQDAVFNGEFSRLVALYGPAGAARAWYGGEKNMNNLSSMDVNRKLNIGQYQEKFTRAFGKWKMKSGEEVDIGGTQ